MEKIVRRLEPGSSCVAVELEVAIRCRRRLVVENHGHVALMGEGIGAAEMATAADRFDADTGPELPRTEMATTEIW